MATIQNVPGINTAREEMFQLLTDPLGRCHSEESTRTRPTHARSLFTLTLIALLLSGLALLLGPVPSARAATQDREDGHVYVLDNDLSGSNSITTFTRKEDGSLKLLGTTSIGGLGSVSAFADGTQGSLIITHDKGTRLFAVDAGSNQISVVNVNGGQLSLAGVFSSGGTGPISLSYYDGLLYVLNAANGTSAAANVAGFHVDNQGNLHPITGATRPLTLPSPIPPRCRLTLLVALC